jgi:dTDP-4-amino-4,6-dideoxygalactose transaminase
MAKIETNPTQWIPFNKPYLTGNELPNISIAHQNAHFSGDGYFTKLCQNWLERLGGHEKALLTHSCTAALEMAAILCNIEEGDEIIIPSYTFVSTANAFVLRGGVPVFVDIKYDTLNIDETKIEAAITKRTKVIVAVHYAGVACEMDAIMAISHKYNLWVIEDAAQACMATYNGKPLGSIGHIGCVSFHETKNIICGEGGALLINDKNLVTRSEIIREKGTNRSRFLRGEVDKYTWNDIGSSYLMSEILAAFLWGQMCCAQEITEHRKKIWNYYHDHLSVLDNQIQRPFLPLNSNHNAHIYYIINRSELERHQLILALKHLGVNAVSHYVPLHSSPFISERQEQIQSLPITDYVSSQLIRLPIWIGLSVDQQDRVVEALKKVFSDQF